MAEDTIKCGGFALFTLIILIACFKIYVNLTMALELDIIV